MDIKEKEKGEKDAILVHILMNMLAIMDTREKEREGKDAILAPTLMNM
jgi:hypothetical protein